MAAIVVDGIAYRLLFGSDVINDGVYLELQDPRLTGHQVILVAYRSDVTGHVSISALAENLPFAVVNRFLDAVREEWPAIDTRPA